MAKRDADYEKFGVAMLLVGAAFAKDGDGQKVRQCMIPKLLRGYSVGKVIEAIQKSDREGVKRFLADFGVLMGPKESAIDALLRTHMTDAKTELELTMRDIDNVLQRYEEKEECQGK